MSGDAPDIQPTPQEVANTQLAIKQWQHYQRQAVPLEKQYMGMVKNMNTRGQYDRAAGLAQAGVLEQFDPVQRKAQQEALASGLSPGSGAYLMSQAGVRGQGAKAMGQAAAGAQVAQHDRYTTGLQNILNIGRGQAATAQEGLTATAQNQVDAARNRDQMRWESDQSMGNAAGTMAGMAARPVVNKAMDDYINQGRG